MNKTITALAATIGLGTVSTACVPFVTPNEADYVAKQIAENPELCNTNTIESHTPGKARPLNTTYPSRSGEFNIDYKADAPINNGRLYPIINLTGDCNVENANGYRNSEITLVRQTDISRFNNTAPYGSGSGYVKASYGAPLTPATKPLYTPAEKAAYAAWKAKHS